MTKSATTLVVDEPESADALYIALGRIVEARDARMHGHCERLAGYATALGTRCDLNAADLVALHRGAFLHDIGKIAIPDRVLLKPSALTRREYALIKTHPVIGDELCRTVRSLDVVRGIVRHHHERLDGRGYPDGRRRRDPAARTDRDNRRRLRRVDDDATLSQGDVQRCRLCDDAGRGERGRLLGGAGRAIRRVDRQRRVAARPVLRAGQFRSNREAGVAAEIKDGEISIGGELGIAFEYLLIDARAFAAPPDGVGP